MWPILGALTLVLIEACQKDRDDEIQEVCQGWNKPDNRNTEEYLAKAGVPFDQYEYVSNGGYPPMTVFVEQGLKKWNGDPLNPEEQEYLSRYVAEQKRLCGDQIRTRYGLPIPPPLKQYNIFVTRDQSPLLQAEESPVVVGGVTEWTGETVFSYMRLFYAWPLWKLSDVCCYDQVIAHETMHHFDSLGVLTLAWPATRAFEEGLATYVSYEIVKSLSGPPDLIGKQEIDLKVVKKSGEDFHVCAGGGMQEICAQPDEEELAQCCWDHFVKPFSGPFVFEFPAQSLSLSLNVYNMGGALPYWITAEGYEGHAKVYGALPGPGETYADCDYVPSEWPEELQGGLVCLFTDIGLDLGKEDVSNLVITSWVTGRPTLECGADFYREGTSNDLGEFQWTAEALFPWPYGKELGVVQHTGACFWEHLETTYGAVGVANLIKRFNDIEAFDSDKEYDLLLIMAEELGASPGELQAIIENKFHLSTDGLRKLRVPQVCENP
ncbi:MAG: hypothetical protein HYV03_08205 [Deltaproteobacteria bacterium]|nr:hypothetical protein [Deltaproteobacteria bacterium]